MRKDLTLKILTGVLPAVMLAASVLCMPAAVNAEDEEIHPDNSLPVVYLNIDESRGTIDAMMDSVDHSVYCYGTVSIDVPEGFHYSDFEDLACEDIDGLEMSIRGRGNSTWENQPKRPFKVKLDKKTDIFGLGKNKHWVLLANWFDESLVRDRITAWLGDEMGFDFTPRGVPVDVVMKGENFGEHYLGSYYLSENVRVGENRLEIAELEETDTDPQVITGGYLLQNSYQVPKGSPDRFTTSRGAQWATHTPSFDTEADSLSSEADDTERELVFAGAELEDAYENHVQQEYIQDYVQMFEDVLYEQGTDYRELMDIESAVKYWLIQTFSLNGDAYATGSTYFYKDRDSAGSVGKICWGPLWDFDFGWGHQPYTEGIPYGHEWIKPMLYDRTEGGFVDEVHRQWPVLREALLRLIEDGGVIDKYYEETKSSAAQDIRLYRPDSEQTYADHVEKLKSWIRARLAWMDENIGQVDTMVHKVTYIVDGEVCSVDYKADGEYIDGTEEHPDREGYVFIGWLDEDGNKIDSMEYVTEDRTITAKYLTDEEAVHVTDIAFAKDNDVFRYNVHIFMYQIPYALIPEDADETKVEWSSSDESWATVDEEGMVSYNGPGTAVFTAKLKYGTTRQFTLTVLDGELPVPESVRPDEEEIRLKPGEQSPFSISTDPSPAKIYEYIYESGDESVVSVGEYGVLTAVGEGQTQVRVTAVSYDEDGNEITLETYTTVIVSDAEPEEAVYTVAEGGQS